MHASGGSSYLQDLANVLQLISDGARGERTLPIRPFTPALAVEGRREREGIIAGHVGARLLPQRARVVLPCVVGDEAAINHVHVQKRHRRPILRCLDGPLVLRDHRLPMRIVAPACQRRVS